MTISYTMSNHPDTSSPSLPDSIGGNISLGYALHRRSLDRERAALARTLATTRTPAPIRDWLGACLIRLGRAIAGPARIEASAPSPRLGTS